MHLTTEQKADLFKALATKAMLEVGLQFGLDKHYSSKSSIRAKAHQAYREVLMNPEAFGVSQDTVELVQKAVSARKNQNQHTGAMVPMAEKDKALAEMPFEDLVKSNSRKLALLMSKKADMLMRSPAELKKIPINALAMAMGVAFDKSQIVKGEATEHVYLKAKVSEDMTPAQKMELILKMRELNQGDGK